MEEPMTQIDLFTGLPVPEQKAEADTPPKQVGGPVIYTMGYLAQGFFEELKNNQGIKRVVDVRTSPWSRIPAYSGKEFEANCRMIGEVDYIWLKKLGGKGWVPPLEREAALDQLKPGDCLVCMEANPNQCHRKSLLAPMLEKRGYTVIHLTSRR